MRNTSLYKLAKHCLIFSFTGLTFAAAAQTNNDGGWEHYLGLQKVSAENDDWTRHFRIGALVGFNIGANFNEKGLFNISGNNAANGIYDDGYVRVDQTGNAGGYTGYWGYNNASQYNAAAQTLTMHSASSYSTAGSSKDDGGPFPGFDMAYGGNLWYWRHVRIGWELGFGLLPITITDNQSLSATVNQSAYTFDTGSIVVPGAPYQGGSSGRGPLIPGTPASVTSQTLSAGTVTGTRTLDVMLYTVRLGPSFYWDLTENTSMSVSAGPAVGIASGDYSFDETIITGNTSAHNTGSFGATDVVYGGYVNAMLMYHIVDNGRNADLYIGAQYMPMGNATFSNGGREGRLNLDGQLYLSVGINWPF
jgi:hypothetical protein